MEIYTDASGTGLLAIYPVGQKPMTFQSGHRTDNIETYEFEALILAYWIHGPSHSYHSDNKGAIQQAKKQFPSFRIQYVMGKANPADPFTR